MLHHVTLATLLAYIFFVSATASNLYPCFLKTVYKRTWPPSDPNTRKECLSGVYDMRIHPHLQRHAKEHNSLCDYVKKFQRRFHKRVKGTCFYQAVLILNRVKRNSFDYYPQPVGHFRMLKDVRSGKPVYEAPINDPPLGIIKVPNTCERRRDFVLILRSCITCFNVRRTQRQTFLNPRIWKNIKFGHVFVMGISARNPVKTFYFDARRIKRRLYPDSSNTAGWMAEMFAEESRYHDMLIGDFEEDGYHHVSTYILSLRWASVFCNKKVKLFGFMEGNFAVIPYTFSNWVKQIPSRQKPRYYGGHLYRNARVSHNVKHPWGSSWQEMPWSKYPPYVHRKFTVFGHDTMQEAAIMSAWTKYSHILSVYIALVNRKLRIHPKNINGLYTRLQNRGQIRKALIADMSSANRFVNWRTGKPK